MEAEIFGFGAVFGEGLGAAQGTVQVVAGGVVGRAKNVRSRLLTSSALPLPGNLPRAGAAA